MKSLPFAACSLGALAVLAAASPVLAQSRKAAAPASAPAPAAAPAVAPLPPLTASVPGVCVLSQEGLLSSSTVGAYVLSRLQQLAGQAQAELQATGAALQNDARTLEGQKATLQSDVYNQRMQALAQRDQALRQTAQVRQRELELTRQKALQHIWAEAVPLIGTIEVQRNCGIVLEGSGALSVNPAMDLTPAVIQQLNGKITQFPFDREHVEQGAAPAGG